MRLLPAIILLTLAAVPARAEALRAAAVGCRTPTDATTVAAMPVRDKAATRPLVVSGACLDLAKGVAVDVDERRPPLACVRLTGDLSCYWIAASLVDDHPGQKAGSAKQGGGSRRH